MPPRSTKRSENTFAAGRSTVSTACGLAALRVAVYEMKYLEGIPAKVSAAEAVAIVKKYADEKEGKFVNGVLGEYIKNELSDQKEN